MLRYLRKEQLKVLVGIKLVCLGSLSQAVEYSAGLGSVGRFDKDKILSADGERADSLLRSLFTYMDKLRRERSNRM